MRRGKLVVSFTFLLLTSHLAKAQEELSLAAAIQKGLQNNFNILIEQKRVDAAENNNSWGAAGALPTINLTLNQGNVFTDNVETASPFQAQGLIINNSFTPGANLDWTLFNGFKVHINKNKLDQLQQESSGNADIVVANALQSIVLGYYVVALEKERLDVFQESLNLSRDKYRYLQLKKEFGAAVTSDLLLEEGNYLTDSVNFINQQLKYRDAVRNLNVLMAEEETDKTYILTDALSLRLEKYDYKVLKEKMIAENIDLKKQYISQSILKYDRQLQHRDRYPQLTLNVAGSNNNSSIDYSEATFPNATGDFQDKISSVTNNYNATFRLTFNLFNGGRINRAIENAIILEDIGNIQADQLKASLGKDLSSAYDSYEVRKKIHGINNRKLEAAKLNLNLSEDKFKSGTINSFDYRTIQNNYLLASLQELQSRYDLMEADISLMRLTGGILESYKQ